MAAKNKNRKRSEAGRKASFQSKEDDMEAENGSVEEDENHGANGGDEGAGNDDEFSLEEVLRLGGTQVSPPTTWIFSKLVQVFVHIVLTLRYEVSVPEM